MLNTRTTISSEEIGTFKKENLKYLDNILSIKNISDFDVDFIMSRLQLNPSVIELLKSAIEQYDKNSDIKKSATYSDYLYMVARSIELMENSSKKLSDELNNDKISIKKQKRLLNLIVKKSSGILDSKENNKTFGDFNFSKILDD